jgi:two-component system, cell cycle sensor histidine kinase and response regulator CckA
MEAPLFIGVSRSDNVVRVAPTFKGSLVRTALLSLCPELRHSFEEMVGKTQTLLAEWLERCGCAALDVALSSAPDIVAVVDREFKIRYINYTKQGFTRDGVVGCSVFDITPPGYLEVSRAAFERVFATGSPDTYEVIFKSDETLHIWNVRLGAITIEGQIVGAVVLNIEVSEERKRSVERDRFFLLSLDMLAVVRPNGHFRTVNPALRQVLGYEEGELLSCPFVDFVHVEDKERTQRAFEFVVAGNQVSDFENRYLCKDGAYRVFSWRATLDPITGDVYAVARDVTQQRNTEVQLRHAQKMEAVGQLAGGVAHDFNNLMLAVLANTELALGEKDIAANVAEHLGEIREAGERAAALTKQLLAFSRRQPIRPVVVNMNDLLRGLMKMLRRLLPANIALEFVPGHQLACVSAEASQLEQVVVNLCVNARDAMVNGGRLMVETENVLINRRYADTHPWAKPGRYVLLSVTDTGVGMTREAQERAFEPFFTTKPPHQGTGLGLSTVYGIVRQHDGMVHLYSELGHGTTFKVYLPTSTRDADEVGNKLLFEPMRGQETILLAEDEPQVRRAVAQVLERAGYRVILASNGAEALQVLGKTQEQVHLAILDVVMPELGGPEVWAQIRATRPGMRVLFASGYADNRFASRIPATAALLEKPYSIDELLLRVREVLDEG